MEEDKLKLLLEGIKNIPDKKMVDGLKKEISKLLVSYSREDILSWIALTSVLEGNELYQDRFSFLGMIVLSMNDSDFLNKLSLDKDSFLEILTLTEKVSWTHVEDYEPRRNNKDNLIGVDNLEYYFLPGGLDNPEDDLEALVKRYHELLKKEKTKKFDIKEEVIKILKFQTELINFTSSIEKNKTRIWAIPNKNDVVVCKDILFNKKNKFYFANSEKESISENIDELYEDVDGALLKNPFPEGIPYFPYLLIQSLITHARSLARKNINRGLLKSQLKIEVLNSIMEIIPPEAILYDFSVNNIREKIDLGFIYENKFFIFLLAEEIFNPGLFYKEIEKKERLVKKLEMASKKGMKINLGKFSKELDKDIEPIFFLVVDDLDQKAYPVTLTKNKNSLALDHNSLRYIFEDLSDKNESIIYLIKVIKKFYEIKPLSSFGFGDFYVFISEGGNYAFKYLNEGGQMILDPHFFSKSEFETIKKRRPRLDYRPKDFDIPFMFKIRKIEDRLFSGYNRIIDYYFSLVKKENSKVFVIYDTNQNKSPQGTYFKTLFSGMISHWIEQIPNEIWVKDGKDMSIHLETVEEAIAIGLDKKYLEEPLIISNLSSNELRVVFNPEKVFEKYLEGDPKIFIFLFHQIISQIVSEEDLEKIRSIFDYTYLRNNFVINQIPVNSKNAYALTSHPTNLDIFDVEIKILKFLKDNNYSPGEYKAKQANKLIRKLYSYLSEILIEKLKNYNLESTIKFGLFESDNVISGRKIDEANLILSSRAEYKKEFQDKILDKERIRTSYFPSLRYLMEQSIVNDIKGEKNMDIETWQEINALTKRILELSTFSEIIVNQYEVMNAKLKLSFEPYAEFDISIEDNPIFKQLQENIEGYSDNGINLEDRFPKEREDDPKKFLKSFRKKIDKSDLGTVNGILKREFGFDLPEYVLVLNMMTHLQEDSDKFGVIEKDYKEVVKFLKEKTFLDEKTINSVLEFSIIWFNESDSGIIEPWRVNGRKNRLTIKPIIKIREKLLFSSELLVMAEEIVFNSILNGNWPWISQDYLSRELDRELTALRDKTSIRFEDAVLERLKKITSFCDKRIKSQSNRNEKCFKNISEICPGEIDCLSVHPEKKLIIIWEAKNLTPKYGSREISWDIKDFIKENGFIQNLMSKRDFAEKYAMEVLDYYGIDQDNGWKVVECIVFSKNFLLRSILQKKVNTVVFGGIEEFISQQN